MSRYSLAAAFILTAVNVQAQAGDDAWSYLPVKLPKSLSDMSISLLTSGGGNSTATATDNDGAGSVTRRIILTGGCDSPSGNEYKEYDWGEGFECTSLSSKVRYLLGCVLRCNLLFHYIFSCRRREATVFLQMLCSLSHSLSLYIH